MITALFLVEAKRIFFLKLAVYKDTRRRNLKERNFCSHHREKFESKLLRCHLFNNNFSTYHLEHKTTTTK
jgi:hypothetical protein